MLFPTGLKGSKYCLYEKKEISCAYIDRKSSVQMVSTIPMWESNGWLLYCCCSSCLLLDHGLPLRGFGLCGAATEYIMYVMYVMDESLRKYSNQRIFEHLHTYPNILELKFMRRSFQNQNLLMHDDDNEDFM